MSSQIDDLQAIIFEWFDKYDNKTVSEFIRSYIYNQPVRTDGISELIERFITENGLKDAYTNHLSDIRNPDKIFRSCSSSERGLLQDIQMALLSLSWNRLNNIVNSKPTVVTKIKYKSNKNFNFIKKELLETFECLNRCEQYMYSEKEDNELVEKITKMKNE